MLYAVLRSGKLSQRVTKEKPRKRPRAPPNSATKEERGKINCSVLMVVFFETAHREKAKYSDLGLTTGSSAPTNWYILYWHGFKHPVNLVMSSKSDPVILVLNSLSRSLEEIFCKRRRRKGFNLNWLLLTHGSLLGGSHSVLQPTY